jgi:hypothetical protein
LRSIDPVGFFSREIKAFGTACVASYHQKNALTSPQEKFRVLADNVGLAQSQCFVGGRDMAVLFVYEAIGNSGELLKKYQAATNKFRDPKYQKGLIAHICLETPKGIQVLNLMESSEHMNKLINDPDLGKVVDDVDLEAVDVSYSQYHYKVHDFYVKA